VAFQIGGFERRCMIGGGARDRPKMNIIPANRRADATKRGSVKMEAEMEVNPPFLGRSTPGGKGQASSRSIRFLLDLLKANHPPFTF
jgi:hypothetical protein